MSRSLVEESETSDAAAAEERARVLRQRFGEERVGLVHGRMKGPDKDAVMARFASGELALLVATTVIEVGVDVPNATLMIVEGAERFGLAQLHQLRGRVGRGEGKSICLLIRGPMLSESGRARLSLMRETNDGFLNDIRRRALQPGHVRHALETATAGSVAEGAVGAGAGAAPGSLGAGLLAAAVLGAIRGASTSPYDGPRGTIRGCCGRDGSADGPAPSDDVGRRFP